ncbi:MAG: thiamine phosphate synthase [Rivihabitans pingtungensis]
MAGRLAGGRRAPEQRTAGRLPPAPDFAWVGASAHRPEELQHAAELGLDYALLGHVPPTASHPDAPPLGWQGLARQLASAGPRLPVYALGGLPPPTCPPPVAGAARARR